MSLSMATEKHVYIKHNGVCQQHSTVIAVYIDHIISILPQLVLFEGPDSLHIMKHELDVCPAFGYLLSYWTR